MGRPFMKDQKFMIFKYTGKSFDGMNYVSNNSRKFMMEENIRVKKIFRELSFQLDGAFSYTIEVLYTQRAKEK